MKEITVTADGTGMATVKNPHDEWIGANVLNNFTPCRNELYKKFNQDNPPRPLFRDGKQVFEDGAFHADKKMQEHLPFYKENEWTDCEIDGYDPIVTTGAITRQIFDIITPQLLGKDEQVESNEEVVNSDSGDDDLFNQIENTLFSAYLIGKENRGNFESWQKRNDIVNTIIGYFNDKQPTIDTVDTSKYVSVINEADNSQIADENTSKEVEDLAEECAKLWGNNSGSIAAYNGVHSGYGLGHTAAKEKVVDILVKYGNSDEMPYWEMVELIKAL